MKIISSLIIFASVILGADVSINYTAATKTGSYRSGLTTADAANIDTTTATVPVLNINLKQSVRVNLKFSVASATCKIHCVRGESNPDHTAWRPVNKTSATATADPLLTVGGAYIADDLLFDGAGFNYCKIYIEAPSSGSVAIDVSMQ